MEDDQHRHQRDYHQAGQCTHLEILLEGTEKQDPAVALIPQDTAHHRVVKGSGGRPQRHQGNGAHQPKHAQNQQIGDLFRQAVDAVLRVKDSHGNASL